MGSSNDDSNESKPPETEHTVDVAAIRDLTERMPLRLGQDPTGRLAGRLMEVIIKNDDGRPHVWFAGLMVTSYALQRMLKDGHNISSEMMSAIFAQAMEIADSMQIKITYNAVANDSPETPKGA